MNRTLKDIHYMLAEIWIARDGLGLNAFDNPVFCTLAERYSFVCDNYEQAKEIIKEAIKETMS